MGQAGQEVVSRGEIPTSKSKCRANKVLRFYTPAGGSIYKQPLLITSVVQGWSLVGGTHD
jgi:hypothetical protein